MCQNIQTNNEQYCLTSITTPNTNRITSFIIVSTFTCYPFGAKTVYVLSPKCHFPTYRKTPFLKFYFYIKQHTLPFIHSVSIVTLLQIQIRLQTMFPQYYMQPLHSNVMLVAYLLDFQWGNPAEFIFSTNGFLRLNSFDCPNFD